MIALVLVGGMIVTAIALTAVAAVHDVADDPEIAIIIVGASIAWPLSVIFALVAFTVWGTKNVVEWLTRESDEAVSLKMFTTGCPVHGKQYLDSSWCCWKCEGDTP